MKCSTYGCFYIRRNADLCVSHDDENDPHAEDIHEINQPLEEEFYIIQDNQTPVRIRLTISLGYIIMYCISKK